MASTPPADALVAAAIILGAVVVLASSKVRAAFDGAVARLARGLRRIQFSPSTSDVATDLLRLDLLRIALGVLVVTRFWPDFVAAHVNGPRRAEAATLLGLGLGGALTIGVATPVAALLLALSLNLVIDYFAGNYSLGSMVVAICLIPLIVAPAGYTRSIDAVLMRRRGSVGALVRWLYGTWGSPTVDRIQIGSFLAFTAYATITLYSGVQHLASPTWRGGAMTAVLLLSPIASPSIAGMAQQVYTAAHAPFVLLSLLCTYGMLAWQLALFPLALLSRWTRRAVIVWGLFYFLFATYVMHLRRLGIYEVVLWALIFWAGRPDFAARRHDAVRVPSLPVRGWIASAVVVSVIVLWGAFVTDWARQGNLANAERRAPIVFGLGAVNVFNEWDLKILRNHAAPIQPADLGTPLTFTPNEALDRQLSQRLWANAPLAVFCDPGYARMWFRGFSDSLPASHPARRRTFSMQFSSWTHPTNEELRTFRPVPITWETRCIVHIDPQRLDQETIEYFGVRAAQQPGP